MIYSVQISRWGDKDKKTVNEVKFYMIKINIDI